MYHISCHTKDGAYDTGRVVNTQRECRDYVKEWADPENLSVTITDDDNRVVGEKPFGRINIKWLNWIN